MALDLRKATESDAENLFHWRNDAETRANSFHTEFISYEEHVTWLATTLRNPTQELYILCKEGTPIGQVRLSTEGNSATISYSIDAAYRAQGYGQTILRLVESICVQRENPQILLGYVKKKNIASQVIFERLGYTCKDLADNDCLLYMKQILM